MTSVEALRSGSGKVKLLLSLLGGDSEPFLFPLGIEECDKMQENGETKHSRLVDHLHLAGSNGIACTSFQNQFIECDSGNRYPLP